MQRRCAHCRTSYGIDEEWIATEGTTIGCHVCGRRFWVRPPQGTVCRAEENGGYTIHAPDGRHVTYADAAEVQGQILLGELGPDDRVVDRYGDTERLVALEMFAVFFRKETPPKIHVSETPPYGFDTRFRRLEPSVPRLDTPPERVAVSSRRGTRRFGSAPTSSTLKPPEGQSPPPARPEPLPIMSWDDDQPIPLAPRVPSISRASDTGSNPAAARSQEPAPAGSRTPPSGSEILLGIQPDTPPLSWEPEIFDQRERPTARPPKPPKKRSRRLGWGLGALVLAGGIALAVWPWLSDRQTIPSNLVRIDGLIREGNEALLRGDTASAQEKFERASELAPDDVRALAGLADVAAREADEAWIFERLVRDLRTEDALYARLKLAQLARSAVARCLAARRVAEGDDTIRTSCAIAYRAAGDLDRAREISKPLQQKGRASPASYAIAMIDLASDEPPSDATIGRLRTIIESGAAPAEAHVALVMAFGMRGDGDAAAEAYRKLSLFVQPSRLLGPLREWLDARGHGESVERLESAPVAEQAPRPSEERPAGQIVPAPADRPKPAVVLAERHDGDRRKSDPAARLARADFAREKGDLDEAESLYRSVLPELRMGARALEGLAEVARARKKTVDARGLYKRALSADPERISTYVALGDLEWAEGRRKSAALIYEDALRRFGVTSLPPHVQQRYDMMSPEPGAH